MAAISFGGMPLSIRDRPDEATGMAVLHAVLDAVIWPRASQRRSGLLTPR
ncbi:MAG: hypothetical protein IIB90_13560 [Gemmatimonadetes bacterium]|nr:hypothetical protein [Gemmatimonadota bacterium]